MIKLKDSEKFKIFEDAFKEAKEGELYKYDEWLKKNGVKPNALNPYHIFSFIRANSDKMIGNEEFITKIGKYIGHFLKDMDKTYHIPIIGVRGSGKTLLMRITENFTNSVETNLARMINADELDGIIRGKIVSAENKQTSKRGAITFLDNCEKTREIKEILEYTIKLRDNGVYITSWTPESWIEFTNKNKDFPIANEKLVMLPFEDNLNFQNFLESVFTALTIDKRINTPELYPFPDFLNATEFLAKDEFQTKIYEFSHGFPLLTIELLLESIKQTFLNDKKELDKEIIETIAKKKGLYDIEERLKDISSQHLLILIRLLQEEKNKGIRPMELVKEFSLDKSTIAYHLKELMKEKRNLIEVNKIGKSSYYKIKENLIPFIQQKIIEEMIEKK